MKNDFLIFILSLFLCLTSCEHHQGESKSAPAQPGGDTLLSDKDQAIMQLAIKDSSKFHFFVENPAGTLDYQRFNFDKNHWQNVEYTIHQPFISGPLHTGRIIYQKDLWQDSSWFFLYSKQLDRGMVLEVRPFALIEINDNPLKSVYIVVPVREDLHPPGCPSFDDWFTTCNDQRYFIQYWIERQFEPRFIRRLQWKPFSWPGIH